MNGIAIVIVTHNSEDVILPCLDACLPYGSEVIVVDNASSDDTLGKVRQRPAVHLIANTENRGFAAGVNQGIARTRQPLVLLLNPDAVLTSSLGALALACSRPETGAAGGRLTGADGEFQRGFSFRRFPRPLTLIFEVLGINRILQSNPVNRRYRCLDYNGDQAADVEQPAGAFLMTRRDAWERLAGLDERFRPVWFEDVDYCKRMNELGLRIRYEPGATATHIGGHSARKLEWGVRELFWYGSLLEYAGKHFTRQPVRMVGVAVVGGACLRSVTGMFRFRSLEPFSIYGKVMRLAWRYVRDPASGSEVASSGNSSRTLIDQAQIHVL